MAPRTRSAAARPSTTARSRPTAPTQAAAPAPAPAAPAPAPAAARRAAPSAKPAVSVKAKAATQATPDGGKASAKPGKSSGKPAKPTGKPAKVPKLRHKLVRDSFTMPEADFSLIATLKARAMAAQRETKKSELLRAGLHALASLDAQALLTALQQLEPVKIGRPKSR